MEACVTIQATDLLIRSVFALIPMPVMRVSTSSASALIIRAQTEVCASRLRVSRYRTLEFTKQFNTTASAVRVRPRGADLISSLAVKTAIRHEFGTRAVFVTRRVFITTARPVKNAKMVVHARTSLLSKKTLSLARVDRSMLVVSSTTARNRFSIVIQREGLTPRA